MKKYDKTISNPSAKDHKSLIKKLQKDEVNEKILFNMGENVKFG